VLGHFRAIGEARELLDRKREVVLLCKCCAEGNTEAVQASLERMKKQLRMSSAAMALPFSERFSPLKAAQGHEAVLALISPVFPTPNTEGKTELT
jgi:hypothetical protein